MLADFDTAVPEIDPFLLDLAYARAINLIDQNILTWRQMHSPKELLDQANETQRDDEFFYRGGATALEELKLELQGQQATVFLES
jgi:hypothetical protein